MTSPHGPWIRSVAWDEAEGVLRAAYDWQAERLGEPTEFTMLGGLYPDLVLERLRLYKVVESCPSRLRAEERVIAALVASDINDTPHCSSGLRVRLDTLGVSPDLVARILADPTAHASGDARLDAIAAYAARLTTSPASITAADIDELRRVGLDDLEILDVNNMVAYFNYVNRVANGLGLHSEIPASHALHAAPR
jgi:uncharacterized peroxidase-related enzyme